MAIDKSEPLGSVTINIPAKIGITVSIGSFAAKKNSVDRITISIRAKALAKSIPAVQLAVSPKSMVTVKSTSVAQKNAEVNSALSNSKLFNRKILPGTNVSRIIF
ncbi:MAG: hypothetical protein LWX56_02220 [Ignavibacteria bacterium]|nr:hypothetical protein [Ignavibacteria bacterium]